MKFYYVIFRMVKILYIFLGIMILDEDKNIIVSSPSILKLTSCEDY